jgi:hypothetical protein
MESSEGTIYTCTGIGVDQMPTIFSDVPGDSELPFCSVDLGKTARRI